MFGFFWQLFLGTITTLELAFASLGLGLLLGVIFAFLESLPKQRLNIVISSFIFLIRSVPELLVLFLVYFGLTALLTHFTGNYVEISPFLAGTIALGLLFGAYASQVLRSALLAVPNGQIEAALALGFTQTKIFFRIQLPQALRYALPGLGNLWLILLKDTAIVMLIGLSDLMNYAKLAATTTQQPFLFYMSAALIYLCITKLSQKFIKLLANKPIMGGLT